MKQVVLSGLIIVGLTFSVLYANKGQDNLATSIEEVSMIQQQLNLERLKEEPWVIAKKSISGLLKKTNDISKYKMVKQKI